MPDYAYESVRRVVYDGWSFVPVCEQCGRFVKADPALQMKACPRSWDAIPDLEPANADCACCGRTHMVYEGGAW